MFAVTVVFRIKPGSFEAFLPLMRKNAETSLAVEPGCKVFDVCTDSERPNEVFLYELYEDSAAFDVHLKSSHFNDFGSASSSMVEGKTVVTYSDVSR